MGYYGDSHPRHGHRTPAELAEDEILEALHGNVCVPGHTEETGPSGTESVRHTHVALLPWADAHPLTGASVAPPLADKRTPPTPTEAASPPPKPKQRRRAVTTRTAQTPAAESRPAAAASGFRLLFRPGTSFKLLLAIENDDNARTAICVADALTARGATPRVISAVELMTSTPGTPDSMVSYAEATLGEDFHYHRRRSLQALIAAATGRDQDWPITSLVGDAALCIAREAEAQHSELIVMGIHQHGAFEQAIGENTATRVMGRASVPVLGVRPALSGLPRRIMVATDFGDASREAAHLAANLAEPGGCVILVHASLPSPIVEEGDEGAALVQREGIEHAFLHLAEEISKGKSIRVETVSRTGDAGAQLMAAASQISPDLIVIASQRHHLITRLMLGSVSRKLVREGRWPMLL
ncbi:MAG TPA: universal stress protein, partial [Gemmatimonadaceae bacterium]|nr:universal stress protein [Gemmatimonadaceae bacterium]